MVRSTIWAAAFGIAFALSSGSAHAKLTLCNQDDAPISFAVVMEEGILFLRRSVAYGWIHLPQNQCHTVAEGREAQFAFLSIRKVVEGGEYHLLRYPIGSFSDGQKAGSTGAERVFCVREESFRVEGKSFDSHIDCPSGFYKQVFNYVMGAEQRTEFTGTVR